MDPNKSPPPDPCQNGRRKTHKPLAGFHASEHRTKLHLLLWNDFCHHVSCILVYVNLLQLESFLFCSITNPVISDFNMFCSRVICGILAQVYCTLLSQYTTYSSCCIPSSLKNVFIHTNSFPASVTAIYSASVVDKATHFCSLDCHDTAPPAKVNK